MFRRRRRDGADPVPPDGSEDEYQAEDEYQGEDEYQAEDEDDLAADEYLDEQDDQANFGPAGEDQEQSAAAQGSGARKPERADLSDPTTWTRLRDTAPAEPAHSRSEGPWDSGDSFPEAERADLGSMLVPVREGTDLQIAVTEESGISVAVVVGDSALQLQPFAAPRSSGLWQEVLPEIATEVASAGGRSQQQEGPFGPELLAWITPPPAEDGQQLPPQPLRFLGVDGPRWFLRGLISGPAAVDAALARPLEDAFAEVVVVRGEHAVPPRQPLEIQLPPEARQALESQFEQQPGMPNPFERGPEITETR
ncbi:MAG TPA: DUF3710 domain-containing protein [Streptosporangiaceae bacterium]|nr:DUF3710 domain-containing protein [Streptosporangiaceae bacterium]